MEHLVAISNIGETAQLYAAGPASIRAIVASASTGRAQGDGKSTEAADDQWEQLKQAGDDQSTNPCPYV
jgi:hypothetical protein